MDAPPVSDVAPFTGAWIEIYDNRYTGLGKQVAPFTGAWIEMTEAEKKKYLDDGSHPSRVRGLKYQVFDIVFCIH